MSTESRGRAGVRAGENSSSTAMGSSGDRGASLADSVGRQRPPSQSCHSRRCPWVPALQIGPTRLRTHSIKASTRFTASTASMTWTDTSTSHPDTSTSHPSTVPAA